MSLLVIGSMALDTIETPYGKAEYILGGSATFIATAASYFTNDIRLVGKVGYDFPTAEIEFLKSKNIDIRGLEVSKTQKTFHWHGIYHNDMNNRTSITTDLNALGDFDPAIPESFRDSEFVCLGNVDPFIQMRIIKQINKPRLLMVDTMNFWIEGKWNELMEVLKYASVLVINDSEARLLSGVNNLIESARKIFNLGPEIIIIKKGEHGAMLFTKDSLFVLPAYPTEKVFDPTGAGDSFAGGFIGWLDRTKDLNIENLKIAIVFGTVIASLTVEQFSLEGIRNLSTDDINKRLSEFRNITQFKEVKL
ncbi:MAG: PfkB family carbohydrate kinase [Ignavibacteria bacterium]